MNNKYFECKKCGTLFLKKIIQGDVPKRCPYCHEPALEFHDLDKANWSAGDFYPDETERG